MDTISRDKKFEISKKKKRSPSNGNYQTASKRRRKRREIESHSRGKNSNKSYKFPRKIRRGGKEKLSINHSDAWVYATISDTQKIHTQAHKHTLSMVSLIPLKKADTYSILSLSSCFSSRFFFILFASLLCLTFVVSVWCNSFWACAHVLYGSHICAHTIELRVEKKNT